MRNRAAVTPRLVATAIFAAGLAGTIHHATAQEMSPAPAGEASAPANPSQDQALAERVKETLLGDAAMEGIRLVIRAINGTVELSGVARDRDQAERAVALAKSVPGVTEVLHNIQVV